MLHLSEFNSEAVPYRNGAEIRGSTFVMVFGPKFKRKKGPQIGRRFKNGHTYRRAQEQRAAIAASAVAGTVPTANPIGADAAVDERYDSAQRAAISRIFLQAPVILLSPL